MILFFDFFHNKIILAISIEKYFHLSLSKHIENTFVNVYVRQK